MAGRAGKGPFEAVNRRALAPGRDHAAGAMQLIVVGAGSEVCAVLTAGIAAKDTPVLAHVALENRPAQLGDCAASGRAQLIYMPGRHAVPCTPCPPGDAARRQMMQLEISSRVSSISCSTTDRYLARWHRSRTSPPATD